MHSEVPRDRVVVAQIEKAEHAEAVGRYDEYDVIRGILPNDLGVVEHDGGIVAKCATMDVEKHRTEVTLNGGVQTNGRPTCQYR